MKIAGDRRFFVCSLFIFATLSTQSMADISEREKDLRQLIAEEGLDKVLVDLVAYWTDNLPIVDTKYESGATWTAIEGAAWSDSIHWFVHSNVDDPLIDEFKTRKLEQQCVEYEGIYTRNGVKLRYHLFDSDGIPKGGFTLNNQICEEYITSRER